MRVPACDGCWPAFWMLPAQVGWPPEIDIFEFFDSDTDKHAYLSTHWGTQTDHRYQSAWSSDRLLTDDWHTYGMLWTETGVQSFIDGVAGPRFTRRGSPARGDVPDPPADGGQGLQHARRRQPADRLRPRLPAGRLSRTDSATSITATPIGFAAVRSRRTAGFGERVVLGLVGCGDEQHVVHEARG